MTSKYYIVALLCFLYIAESSGQGSTSRNGIIQVEITKVKKPKKIYAKVEIISNFAGGDSAWVQSIERKINQSLTYKNGAKMGKYLISVAFLIGRDGNFSDIRIIGAPVGFGMEETVLRVLRKSPGWQPAPYQGIPVRSRRTSSATPAKDTAN